MPKLLTLFLSLIFGCASGQNVKYDWAFSIGTSSNEYGRDIALDHSGSVIITGDFGGSAVDFDPGPQTHALSTNGANDIFIQKIDSSGNLLWAKAIGGTGPDAGLGVDIDSQGNVLVSGYFQGTVDFDPGPGTTSLTSNGGYDCFVVKLDSNGNFIWARTFGSMVQAEMANSITADLYNNVHVTGYFNSTVDFDPDTTVQNITSNGTTDAFVLKLNANGELVWVKSFGGIGPDEGADIHVDQFAEVYVTGHFHDAVDFNPDPLVSDILSSNGARDIFVLKLDSNGVYKWADSFGSNGSQDLGVSITAIKSDALVTGYFHGSVDFDPGPGTLLKNSQGGADIFLVKLDSIGDLKWCRTYGGFGTDVGNAVATDTLGNAFVTGIFENSVNFNPSGNPTSDTAKGLTDIFVMKVDSFGLTKWVKTMGGINAFGFSKGLAVSANGGVYFTGDFGRSIDFDPGNSAKVLTSISNSRDIFVGALSKCSQVITYDSIQTCKKFTGLNGVTYNADTTVVNTYSSGNGCDSIVSLTLTINQPDIAVSLIDSILIARATAVSYQWLDCNRSYSKISGENSQTFTPGIDGFYAVEITENDCVDTSACYEISTIGIRERSPFINTHIFPNPNWGTFTVSSDSKDPFSLRIYGTDGQKVYEGDRIGSGTEISVLSNYPSGIYIVKIITKRGECYKMIVKNNK